MAGDTFGFLTDQSTLFAVVLGAILATIGGFVATVLERTLDRRDKQRNAALFFGEVLSTLAIIIRFADETKKIGEPYGPVTLRMLRSARNELDLYDRNRETLFDLHDADLRAQIQTLLIRLSMPLDGVIEATDDIRSMREQLRTQGDPQERAELERRLLQDESRRELGYEFIIETAQQLKGAISGLEPLAKHSFDRLDRIARS
jgi:DNA-binding transcriptional MerR regulator